MGLYICRCISVVHIRQCRHLSAVACSQMVRAQCYSQAQGFVELTVDYSEDQRSQRIAINNVHLRCAQQPCTRHSCELGTQHWHVYIVVCCNTALKTLGTRVLRSLGPLSLGPGSSAYSLSIQSDAECLLRIPVGVLIGDKSQLSAVQLRLRRLLHTYE